MTLILNGIFGDDELVVFSDKSVIQTGESAEISAYLRSGEEGVTVNFYEVVTPTLTMSTATNIIQTGDTLVLQCKVRDEDGSVVKGQTVEFYKEV